MFYVSFISSSSLSHNSTKPKLPQHKFEVLLRPHTSSLSLWVFSLHVRLRLKVLFHVVNPRLDCIAIGTREISGAGSWRTVIGIGLVWPFILGVGILFMPESPRWLAAHGHPEKAQHSIARAYGIKAADEQANRFVRAEVDEIVNQLEHEKRLQAGWIDCFKPRNKTLYRTLLGMTLQSFQQLTGANYFFYYGATIFVSVGIQDSFVTQIILGAVNFVCTFGGLYVMEKVIILSYASVYKSLAHFSKHSLVVDGRLSLEEYGNLYGFSCLPLQAQPRIPEKTRILANVSCW